jgi:hypothetical protein
VTFQPTRTVSWLLCLTFAWNEWMYASALGYIEARSVSVILARSVNFRTDAGMANVRITSKLPFAVASSWDVNGGETRQPEPKPPH